MIESVMLEKRPKKGFKVKKAPVELLTIPEQDIPVGASQEVIEEVTVHENLRRVSAGGLIYSAQKVFSVLPCSKGLQ